MGTRIYGGMTSYWMRAISRPRPGRRRGHSRPRRRRPPEFHIDAGGESMVMERPAAATTPARTSGTRRPHGPARWPAMAVGSPFLTDFRGRVSCRWIRPQLPATTSRVPRHGLGQGDAAGNLGLLALVDPLQGAGRAPVGLPVQGASAARGRASSSTPRRAWSSSCSCSARYCLTPSQSTSCATRRAQGLRSDDWELAGLAAADAVLAGSPAAGAMTVCSDTDEGHSFQLPSPGDGLAPGW